MVEAERRRDGQRSLVELDPRAAVAVERTARGAVERAQPLRDVGAADVAGGRHASHNGTDGDDADSTANQPPPLARLQPLRAGRRARRGRCAARAASAWEAESSRSGERSAASRSSGAGSRTSTRRVLRTHDRYGERIDEVEFHPAWDSLLRLGVEARLHSLPWVDAAARRARRAGGALHAARPGGGRRRLPALDDVRRRAGAARRSPTLAEEWIPRLTERRRALRDGDDRAPGRLRRARERDDGAPGRRRLGAGRTQVVLLGADERRLPRARAGAGRALLLPARAAAAGLPDRAPEGQARQPLQRLGGDRARRSASRSSSARRAAASRTILEMVNHTRLDCVLGSAALMRRAVAEATHHAAHRSAFGRLLADQPLMQNVLADLCVESEAATVTALRLARAYDEADGPFRRLATAVAKFWVCKRTPPLVAEALECLGGNGYVEESQLPRLFRESPLNSIWEGSGNVNASTCCARSAASPRRRRRSSPRCGSPPAPTRASTPRSARLERELAEPEEQGARRLLELLAVSLQGSLLVRHGAAGGGGRVLRFAPRPARRRLRHASRRPRPGCDRRAAPTAASPGRFGRGRRDPLLPRLKRLRPTGRESRGRAERATASPPRSSRARRASTTCSPTASSSSRSSARAASPRKTRSWRCSLAPAEARRALLEERGDALGEAACRSQPAAARPRARAARRATRVGVVEQPLRQPDPARRQLGVPGRELRGAGGEARRPRRPRRPGPRRAPRLR